MHPAGFSKGGEGDKIRLILDNLKVHSSEETRKYLASIPERFEFVFTPKHGSWLNLIEGFFSKLTRQSLKGIRVKTKEELVERIYKYFEEINADPVVYRWKYKLEEIDPSEEIVVEKLPLKKTDNTFMTNADTPSIAMEGIIDDPVNPFTGKKIDTSEKTKHPQLVTMSQITSTADNNGNVFLTYDADWYSVHDNIFDEDNWTNLGTYEQAKEVVDTGD